MSSQPNVILDVHKHSRMTSGRDAILEWHLIENLFRSGAFDWEATPEWHLYCYFISNFGTKRKLYENFHKINVFWALLDLKVFYSNQQILLITLCLSSFTHVELNINFKIIIWNIQVHCNIMYIYMHVCACMHVHVTDCTHDKLHDFQCICYIAEEISESVHVHK